MILYHGSTDLVDKPKIRVGEVFLDFGVGFYTTTSYEQAERWARIKMRRNNSDIGYVAIYEFDLKKAQNLPKTEKTTSLANDYLIKNYLKVNDLINAQIHLNKKLSLDKNRIMYKYNLYVL